jgi:hypothetical protein
VRCDERSVSHSLTLTHCDTHHYSYIPPTSLWVRVGVRVRVRGRVRVRVRVIFPLRVYVSELELW